MREHRQAAVVIAAAAVLDAVLGVLFAHADHIPVPDGLYFAVTTATTVGYGDITAHGWGAHLVAVLIMVTVVPLFGATFSLMTSGMTAVHVHAAKAELKQHVDRQLRARLAGQRPEGGS